MTTRQPKVHTQLGRVAVQIFAANDRMNQILIEHLDPRAQTLLCDGVAPHPYPQHMKADSSPPCFASGFDDLIDLP